MTNEEKSFLEWLNEMSPKVYQANKDKGFWDNERSDKECIALIISEMSEAMEADRKDSYANWDNFNAELKAQEKGGHKDALKTAFDLHIKDTFEDEIADTVIRILDFVGSKGYEVTELTSGDFFVSDNFAESFFRFCDDAVYYDTVSEGWGLSLLASSAYELMSFYGVERIRTHIELKLKYNSLRPRKHGKTY